MRDADFVQVVDRLANALEILAERTIHMIGDRDAEAVCFLAAEARRIAGPEVGDD